MRDILKLAFGGGCEVVLPKLDTNQVLSRAGGLDHYDDDDDDDQDGDDIPHICHFFSMGTISG